jgi:hypothetical protein
MVSHGDHCDLIVRGQPAGDRLDDRSASASVVRVIRAVETRDDDAPGGQLLTGNVTTHQ